MTPIETLEDHGLAHRAVLAFQRANMLYVEDLLGTSPWYMVVASGPGPAFISDGEHTGRMDTWLAYRYRPAWREISRISEISIQQAIAAIASWMAMNRRLRGKDVADTIRVPI